MDNDTLLNLCREGWNDVSIEKFEGGYAISLTNRSSLDNAVTVFVPDEAYVIWGEFPDDERLEMAVEDMVKGFRQ